LKYNKNILFNPSENNIAVSSNSQILQDIADGDGPHNSMFIIGYTGWSAGQLEFELENNLWLISEPNHDLIFLGKSEEKWSKALATLGISTSDFVDMNLASC
jgi:putative transcriptional regulator